MKNILDRAKKQFDNRGTIQPLLNILTTVGELNELRDALKGNYGPFYKQARKDIKEFQREFKRSCRFKSMVDNIDDLICVPHLMRKDMTNERFRFLSRSLATGTIREFIPTWTGMVSQNAIDNSYEALQDTYKPTKSTYVTSPLNCYEHFYNNLFAANVILSYKLYFDYNRHELEDMCKVFQQVHITTSKENTIVAHNGQNEEQRMSWRTAYRRNNIKLIDVKIIKPVKILRIKDFAPAGVVEKALEMRAKN